MVTNTTMLFEIYRKYLMHFIDYKLIAEYSQNMDTMERELQL